MLQLFEQMILNEAAPRKAKQLNINPDTPPDLTQNNNAQQPQDQQPSPEQPPADAQAQQPPQDPNMQPDQQQQQDFEQQDPASQAAPEDQAGQEGDPNAEGGDQEGEMPQGPEGMGGEEQPQDELDQAESEVFASLKPDQFSIKIKELKQRYKSINDMILSTLEKLNKVSKTSYDANMIDYVTRKLLELKDLSKDSLIQAFPTRTYVENQIELQRIVTTFNILTNMIAQVYDSRVKRAAKYNKDNGISDDKFDFSQNISI